MKIRLLDLPPAVVEGGYAYVLAYSTGTVKVGATKTPAKAVASHVCGAAKSGVEVSGVWMSAAHAAYSHTALILMTMAATLAGDPDAMDSRAEDFTGVDFGQLVGVCHQLSLDEPSTSSEAEGDPPKPEMEPAANASSNVVRMLPWSAPGRSSREMGDPRGAAFADLVIAARSRAGLTQEETEERSGVSRPTISRWERGQVVRPEADHIRSLCRTIGLNAVEALIALGYLETDDFLDWRSA